MVRPKRRSIKPPRKITSAGKKSISETSDRPLLKSSASTATRQSTRDAQAAVSLEPLTSALKSSSASSSAETDAVEDAPSKETVSVVSLPRVEIPAKTKEEVVTEIKGPSGSSVSASEEKDHDSAVNSSAGQGSERTGARFSEKVQSGGGPSSPMSGQSSDLAALRAMPEFFKQDEDGDTYLHVAVAQGNQVLVDFLTKTMRHVTLDIYNKLRQTPLHLAVITKQAGLVQCLTQAGADVNLMDRHGQTAFHLACELDNVECVSAIRRATTGHSERVNLGSVNSQGLAAIHVATLTGDRELISQLIAMGADINAKDANSGRTPLHHAVESGRYHVVAFLLSRGARANERTFSGNTPLHTAAGREMDDIVKLLTESGADVNVANREGDTPKVVKGGSELGKRQLAASRQAPKRRKTSTAPTKRANVKATAASKKEALK